MKADFQRAVVLALISALYWAVALLFIGLMMMGDCYDREVCARSAEQVHRAGLAISGTLYLVLVYLWAKRLRS